MNLPKLSSEEQKKFENGVIQVNGKAMNRTALGIIDAYFTLYPKTTFAELKVAFPDSINPSGPRAPKTIFRPFSERDFGVVHSVEEIKEEFSKVNLSYEGLFFTEQNEMFKTSDGITVVVNKLWESKDTETGESDLENLAKAALKFGIVVNKFEARKPFGKGSYSLEILEPDIFNKIVRPAVVEKIVEVEKEVVVEKIVEVEKEVVVEKIVEVEKEVVIEKIVEVEKEVEKVIIKEKTVEKKIIPFWVWIIIALALIPLILWLAGAFKSEPVVVEKEVEKILVQTDTVYIHLIEQIEVKFNTVQFEVNKFDIPEDSKYALYDLTKLMKKNPKLKLSIEGHTSEEGGINHNQSLSEKRAKSVVDFLISMGVDESRLSYKGLGSSMLKDPNNREVNRRTEFVIIEQ